MILGLNDFDASFDHSTAHWTTFDGCMAVGAAAQMATWQKYNLTLKKTDEMRLEKKVFKV